ncbi:MarR family transcriptional regulator [Actinoplanes sp. Pm04-4]|uniref:MarR family transcriptional regulator n=1 Tax=Paractinoplanes pyxinae TaxID=2997416 RepID=A0ABT4B4N7_9ACTN|nr:MarR family transcriptional regulator [Actinoplanes pyxinae]MCY1141449.1 MarR family transcriptional regulator [Actinoplanes pyxinae]
MERHCEPPELSPDETEAWATLSWLMFELPGRLEAQLRRDSGLSLFENRVLASLATAPERRMPMSDLATFVSGSLSRLSHLVKRLEERGWIRREPSAGDGRFVDAILTNVGLAVVQQATPAHLTAVRQHVFDALHPRQILQLRDIGHQIANHIEPEHAIEMALTAQRPKRSARKS